mgnify:CR=1 FL=1
MPALSWHDSAGTILKGRVGRTHSTTWKKITKMLYKNNSINSQHTRPIWPTHCSTVLDNFISLSLVFVVFPIRDRIANGNIQNMGNQHRACQACRFSPLLSSKRQRRNSSIELLRIIAMFMILTHHFIVHNGYDALKLPLGPERIFFQLVMAGGGKVGVVIFFSISAWFFLDKEQTIKSNLKRVWIMDASSCSGASSS